MHSSSLKIRPDPSRPQRSALRRIAFLVPILGFLSYSLISTSLLSPDVGASGGAIQAPVDGLVAHWPLNEATGTTATDTVGGYDAMLATGATWTQGRMGSGVALDGGSGFIDAPALDVPGAGLSLGAWVRFNAFPSGVDQRIISKAAGIAEQVHFWMLSQTRVGSVQRLRFRLKTGSITTTLIATAGDLQANRWYHAAATYDGALMRVYLDGVEVGRLAKSGSIAVDPAVAVNIGRNPGGTNHLTGAVDELRIYSRALTANELSAVLEDPGAPGPDTTPPSVPAGIDAVADSSTRIHLTWSASTDDRRVTGYRIRRDGSHLVTVAATDYHDAGLTPSTTYHYTVSALDEGGNESAQSELVSVTILAAGLGPMAHWMFDEGTGALAADAAGSADGTLKGGAAWAPGHAGHGVRLNGSSAYVAVPNLDVSGEGLTLAAWVRFDGFPDGEQRIISKASGAANRSHYWMLSQMIRAGGAKRLRFRLRTGSTTTTLTANAGNLEAGRWHHAAAVYDGAAMRLYLDGVEVGRRAKTGSIATNASVPVNIGRNPDGSNYLSGTLDDVRVYDRSLTAADIQSIVGGSSEPPPDTSAPSVPSSLQATPMSATEIALQWGASTDDTAVAGYRIKRDGISAATASATQHNDAGLQPATTYRYTVTAFDQAGNESADSNSVTVTTFLPPDTTPPVLSGIAVSAITEVSATVSWATNEPANSRVRYGTTTAYGKSVSQSTMGTAHALNLAGLLPATTYHYRVRSVDQAGNVAWSGDLVFTTEAPPSHEEPGLVAGWRFDEGSGTTAADWAGGAAATLAGGATWTTGRYGYAIALDGSSGHIVPPAFDIEGNALTLAAWVRFTSFPSGVDQRIISKANGIDEQAHYWMLGQTEVDSTSRLRFRLKTGSVTTTLIASGGDLQTNRWYHATATYDGATMRLYLDGAEVGSVSKTGAIATQSTVAVNIGRNPGGTNHLSGALDDVRVYERALGAEDIRLIVGNLPPTVALTSPAPGASFTAPATIALTAAASDPESSLADVRFYAGGTLLATVTSAPYSFTWNSVPAGEYSITAVARDTEGATATSAAVAVTVSVAGTPTPWRVAFTASTDHESNVTSYLLKVFAAAADPDSATPVASSDLGKPVPDGNREIVVDRTAFFEALAPGNYVMTLSAVGPGGSTRSAAFAFTR